jgi:hypothetical protein
MPCQSMQKLPEWLVDDYKLKNDFVDWEKYRERIMGTNLMKNKNYN